MTSIDCVCVRERITGYYVMVNCILYIIYINAREIERDIEKKFDS